jgi:hypothetical protein
MKYGGHKSSATYTKYYAPKNSGVDGQGTYFGYTPRHFVNDVFRNLTLNRNPDLWQALPAEKKRELESREDFVKIQNELEGLKADPVKNAAERASLHSKVMALRRAELHKCWTTQERNQWSSQEDADYSMGRLRARFARVSRMMPERERLAKNMSLAAPLRSPLGQSVLNDMIALCKQEPKLAIRPGLEPDKCHCRTLSADKSKVDGYVQFVHAFE